MAYEQQNNSGSLFKNDHKKEDKHPDYKGSIKDDQGKVWDLAAWVKTDKNGKKFFSLKTSLPRAIAPSSATPDDLPF